MARLSKKSNSKSKVVKTAAAVAPRRTGTSSKARERVWELLMKNPDMDRETIADRVGLETAAIAMAHKYWNQITTFLREKGKIR